MLYHDVLLSVDLSDDASWKEALPTAVRICQAFKANLHVITVVPEFQASIAQFFPEGYEVKIMGEAEQALQTLIEKQIPAGLTVKRIVVQGPIYHEIIETAEQIGADLIVMASHNPSLRDYLIGPNSAKVVRHFPGSVLVVRPR
jgi:nucleotide-binding universal stress UspA family protein